VVRGEALIAIDIHENRGKGIAYFQIEYLAGYDRYLFHDVRFGADGSEKAEFVLNQAPYRGATILVAAENFGCGSSREAAVWALMA